MSLRDDAHAGIYADLQRTVRLVHRVVPEP
jgi:hypothetical protein